MTQIFTGTGSGLRGSSLDQLGSYGPKGTASLGQGGSSVFVNAANGNLFLKQSDGFLANASLGLDLFQSYNSRDTGAWRFNTDTHLVFEGTANSVGSRVIRTDEDGHQSCFHYDTKQKIYLADDGSTAKLSFDGTSWNYQEGNSQISSHYNQQGQLTRLSDKDGHELRFSYKNGQLTTVTDNSKKQTITWSFSQGLLRDVTFQSDGQTIHHLHYDYDAHHRLNCISRDLGNGKKYWTAYDYAGDTNLMSNIRQSDGTTLHIEYDTKNRIKRLVDGEGRITQYEYFQGKTIVTNGLNESWTYYYDDQARLTGIDGPENYHIHYHYEGKHLDAITQGHLRWSFNYNDAGDCIRSESPTGEIILRTYDHEHRLLSETRYQTFDAQHHPALPQTAHYIYDQQGHLRFNITPDGVVTEYRYDLNGNRISSRCYMQGKWQDEIASLDALVHWSDLQNPQDINLVDYHYDWRGGLCEEIHYTQVNKQGEGISTPDALRTYSRYDAAGLLVEKSSLTAHGLSTTHYVYDDLGRLIKTIDNQQHIQTIDYDDNHQRIIKTDANGLQTLSIYDKSGLLLSTQQLDASHDYGTTMYRYDQAGQLISETDVTGKTRHLFYDAQGRVLATISFNGHVTEYRYDDQGHCVQTHQYQQTVNPSSYSDYAAIKPQTTNQDRISHVIYNEYNQIGWQVDADGAVIAFQYNAQGQVTQKTAYANRLVNYQPFMPLTSLDIRLTPSNDDRTITYYYDTNGRLDAEINGEGGATAYHYDAQGHLTEQIRYKNKITGQRTGDWNFDAPSVDVNCDIHIYNIYDKAGLKIIAIDGEGYLTEYFYDSNALLTETIRYYSRIQTMTTPPTLDNIRLAPHYNDHHTTYRYNDLNQCIEESTSSGLVITYTYNAQGLMISETRADRQTHDMRHQQYRYDALGRIIQSLDAQGAAVLAKNPTLNQDQIEAIWQEHSVHFSYDIAGHLISKTNALNETTRYIYNDAGLLTYTLSPTGAVTEHRYNAFQQVETSIHYSAYMHQPNANLADIKQHIHRLENPNLDEVTHYKYNVLGLLISQKKGNGSTQLTTYNAFGERSQTAQHTSIQADILTDYQYDHRGLLRYRNEDTGGINKTFAVDYDVFGWIEKESDGRYGESIYTHNKRGETILIENQVHEIKKIDYDAFNRILSLDDKTSVRYCYKDQQNTVILERNEMDVRIITQFNALGDKLSITDGNHKTTTFQYNESGQLIHIDAPEHASANYTYDAVGHLIFQQDINGLITHFTYDAEGHVLTKTIAPDSLNITTTYTYDAIGRQLQVNDAGRCTQFSYDNQGNLIETRLDPDSLNLTTKFDYNEFGQLVRETHVNPQGIDSVTAYTRDALGRCLSRTLDPDGLKLITTYTYDNNDNVLTQADPNQNTTRYVYDVNNRLRYYINALGVVTEHRYDDRGNKIQITTYANPVTPSIDYDETTLTALLQPNIHADHHQFFKFDKQGRLITSYDGLGYATTYEYDANDNLITKQQFTEPYSLDELITGVDIVPRGWMRQTSFVYDGLNHQRFRIADNGHLTEFFYNSAGQLIRQSQYEQGISLSDVDFTPSVENIQANIRLKPDRDEHIHYTYDQANRLTMQASATGIVTAYEYDAANNQTASHQYATRLTAAQLNDPEWQHLIQESSDDRITRSVYDAAGRAIYRISPTGHVVERTYDTVGNVLTEIAHAARWPLNTEDNEAHHTQFEYDAIGRMLSQTDAAQHTTRYTYDQNNNVATKTDMNHAVWQYRYNAANQLIETRSPLSSFKTYSNGSWHDETRSIITQHTYDNFGNLSSEIRDAGGINQTVQYTYDANNRKLLTIYPNVAINNATQRASNDRQDMTTTLTEACVYNAFGELIEQRDKAGHSRYYAYDDMGQQIFSVNAEGAIIRYGYDVFGNVISKTMYATPLDTSDYSLNGIAGAVQTDAHDRHEYYSYDHDHRLIETRKDAIRSYNPRTTLYHTLSPTTRLTYNAFGDVITHSVQLTDADWAITTHTYDNDGLKISTLDAEHYLTTYHYNAFGLLNEEIQYALRGTSPTPSSKDRKVSYLYDVKGQLIEKTLKNVAVSHLTGNGTQYETIMRDLTSHYGYDAMGKMVSTTDPEGHTAYSYYNEQGQLMAKVGMKTPAGRAATTYSYDALGQLVSSRQWANGAQVSESGQLTLNQASQFDIVLQDIYDANGHVTEKIDGTGHVTHYSYDANSNIARCWQLLNQSLISDKHYTYNAENHLVQTATMDAKGLHATDDAQYNAFGEVIKKGWDGLFKTQVDYDSSGRVWRSNTQGYFQLYVYDLSDHVTVVLTSTNGFGVSFSREGIDLSNNQYEDYINFNTGDSRYNFQHHMNTYDALGHLISHSQDPHMATGTTRDPLGVSTTQTQTVDRWGNVLLSTNASGYTTRYDYNALNALIEQVLPEVAIVDEHGIAHTLAPVNHYAIDSFGRTIAITDANGHTIAHVYDAEGRIIQDINARNNHRDKTYNLLGQMTNQINEHGSITSYTYDAESRLLSVVTPQTAQYYEYDGMGQVVRQTDAVGNTQNMTYDELGHLTKKSGINGLTDYEYDTEGHKIAEHDANGNTNTWSYDKQGRIERHTDLGGHHTEYTYNTNGLLQTEKSSTGKDIRYIYNADGQVREYADLRHKETAKYTYDIEGNVASKITGRYGDWINEIDHYQYDALGRMSHVKRLKEYSTNPNAPTPDNNLLSIDYEYDAVGNIRDTYVVANYTGYQATSHSDYFKYDENNRIITNKGQLINNQITISGSQGTALAYDETGNIIDAQTFENGVFQHYNYHYNTDNLLEIAYKNNGIIQSKRYKSGRLEEEALFNNKGLSTQHNTLIYSNGRLMGQTTFSFDQRMIIETRYQYDNVGNMVSLTTKDPNYTQTHQYDYELWDSYLQKADNLSISYKGKATTYGKSTHTYDANGLLRDVENTQSPNNATHYYASHLDGIRGRKDRDGETSYLTVAGKTIGDLRLDKQKKQSLNVYGASSLPDIQQNNLGAYTLSSGDTLDSIALQVYGDSSLWYLIADANGITDRFARAGEKGSQLHVGLRLNLPSVTKGQHNTSATQKVLSSNEWIGDTSAVALTPAPPPKKSHSNFWKTIAKIAVVVTAAVVMVMSAGAMAVLAAGTSLSGIGIGTLISTGLSALGGTALTGIGTGATLSMTSTLVVGFGAGFASSIAGQTAANLMHLQNGIDMKGALMSGLGSAVTAGVSHLSNASTVYRELRTTLQQWSPSGFNILSATEMMERDSISQGLNLALNHHQHFDWMELGVSSVTAGLMGSQKAQSWAQRAQEEVGRASAFATSELQVLATGAASGNFDALQILQDNLGNAASASLLQQPLEPNQVESQEMEENYDYCPIPNVEDEGYSAIPEGTWERFHRESEMHKRLEQMNAQYMNESAGSDDSIMDSGSIFGVVGDMAYGNEYSLPVGQGALSLNISENRTSNFDGNYQQVLGLSAKEIWNVRAYQGTPIRNQSVGDVDAIEDLVGFERKQWNLLSEDKISSHLDSLQQYVSNAHDKYPNVPVDLINAVITHESKGSWNAISSTGALGVMQMTQQNYYPIVNGKLVGTSFNPFNPQEAIMHGTKMLSYSLNKFGSTQEGLNKTLAAYNQGLSHVTSAIVQHGSQWLQHINLEGKNYITHVTETRNNKLHIPGYFGERK